MIQVLLLGGCGYLGSALSVHLRMSGYGVSSIDLEKRGGAQDNLKTDFSHLPKSFLSKFPVIVLLAAHSTVAECEADPLGAIDNNVVNPIFLLQKLTGQKFIYMSSGSVTKGQKFASLYDATKREFDLVTPLIYPEAIGLRLGTVCGPSPNIRGTMINQMVMDAMRNNRLTMSNSSYRRPILGIDDFCRSVQFAIENQVSGGCHDLCSFNTTVGDAAGAVSNATGCWIEVGPDSPGYDFTMIPANWCVREQTIDGIIHDLMAEYAHA